MALGSLPPWLNVQPSDYLHAAAAGAQLGHAIADSTLRAWEEQARMRMAAQEAQANREQRAQQQAIDNAMTRLAADRLEQYRQSEIANRQAELGLQQQGLGLREKGLGVQEAREAEAERRGDEIARHNQAMEEARLKSAEQQGKLYGEPVYSDIPGMPGVKAAYRPGSPGIHIITPSRSVGDLTASQAASLLTKIPQLADLDPSITNEVANLRRLAFPKTKGSSRFRYNKQTGKIEEIAPLPQPVAPQTTTDSDEE